MTFLYRAFGMEIAADAPVSGLAPSFSRNEPDVRIHLGHIPPVVPIASLYRNHRLDDSALTVHSLAGGDFLFQYRDETTFLISESGSEIWARWPSGFTPEDAVTYLLGPILGFILRLRGVVSLHASGVVIGGAAIAILGHAGSGKSTTAAAFARLGYPVITDDVFALVDLGDAFQVEPGYAGLRLWPDSVESLWGSVDALPPLTPNWDKRHLDLRGNEFSVAGSRTPVCAIYLLDERSGDAAAPTIRTEPEPLLKLLANSYVNYLLDKPARAHEFDVLGRLARAVPMRRVIPHAQASRLPELCNLIAEDAGALSPSVA